VQKKQRPWLVLIGMTRQVAKEFSTRRNGGSIFLTPGRRPTFLPARPSSLCSCVRAWSA
jgi:hypothetical protein